MGNWGRSNERLCQKERLQIPEDTQEIGIRSVQTHRQGEEESRVRRQPHMTGVSVLHLADSPRAFFGLRTQAFRLLPHAVWSGPWSSESVPQRDSRLSYRYRSSHHNLPGMQGTSTPTKDCVRCVLAPFREHSTRLAGMRRRELAFGIPGSVITCKSTSGTLSPHFGRATWQRGEYYSPLSYRELLYDCICMYDNAEPDADGPDDASIQPSSRPSSLVS